MGIQCSLTYASGHDLFKLVTTSAVHVIGRGRKEGREKGRKEGEKGRLNARHGNL